MISWRNLSYFQSMKLLSQGMNGSILTLLFSSTLNLFHLAVLIKNNKKEWRPGGLIKFKVKEENNWLREDRLQIILLIKKFNLHEIHDVLSSWLLLLFFYGQLLLRTSFSWDYNFLSIRKWFVIINSFLFSLYNCCLSLFSLWQQL